MLTGVDIDIDGVIGEGVPLHDEDAEDAIEETGEELADFLCAS